VAGSLTTYLHVKFDERVDHADDIVQILSEKLPDKTIDHYLTNLDEFIKKIDENFNPTDICEKVYAYESSKKEDATIEYEIYRGKVIWPKVKKFHTRLQIFALFYIYDATYIDLDDENWEIFFLFEKRTSHGSADFSIVGFTTVYPFYAYPDKTRLRVSQMVILPPFQRKGHGTQLLRAVYKFGIEQSVIDVAIEDPNDEFMFLRDITDLELCVDNSIFITKDSTSTNAQKSKNRFVTLSKLTPNIIDNIRQKYKLSKLQIMRCYEILKLMSTDINNSEQYREYRLEIKQRLYKKFMSNELDIDPEEKKKKLDDAFKNLETEYRETINHFIKYHNREVHWVQI